MPGRRGACAFRGLGFGMDLGFRVWGLGFGVEGLGSSPRGGHVFF